MTGSNSQTPRIDAHHHFWDPARFDYPWMVGRDMDPVRRPFGPTDLEPELAAHRIDGTILVQTVSDPTETEQFLDLAARTPFVHGVVGWIDLTAADSDGALNELETRGQGRLVGIRHQAHDEDDPDWLIRDDVRTGIKTVGEHNLAYDVLVRTRELPAAARLIESLPDQRFVLDHIGKPAIASGWDDDWSRRLAELARHPNLAVKLSGMITEANWASWTPSTLAPFIERVLGLFGVDRVMFGSDWPVCLLAATDYGQVINAVESNLEGLSRAESEAVFGGNARRWYALDPATA